MGTPSSPAWLRDDTVYDDVSNCTGMRGVLGDLDSDGDLDLVEACFYEYTSLHLFENVGSATSCSWQEVQGAFGDVVSSEGGSEPSLADIDGDGDVDVVGGTTYGPVRCLENVGTQTDYAFVENPLMLAGVDGPASVGGVELLDIDSDGDLDLMVSPLLGTDNFLYLNEQIVPVERSSWTSIKALYR